MGRSTFAFWMDRVEESDSCTRQYRYSPSLSTVAMPKAVILATSADKLGDHATGAWSEEITGPYYVFKDAGLDVTIASIDGGKIPIDAGSLSDTFKTENDKRFETSGDIAQLEAAVPLSSVNVSDLDILFCSGGHGTCVDFPDKAGEAVTAAYAAGKVVGAVCHGPMALVKAMDGDKPLVAGKKVAAFSDVEEGQVQLTEKVPFLLEVKMKELGAEYVPSDPWSENAVADGKLVTGQNPQSSVKCAKLCLEAL
mmetsp:Transcript_20754/g.52915  ORF Transcript_20754/g.52915 Transcript_20754/m.52915 type:complete len:253 (-) Transcript_20754:273-1031(-)